MIGTLIQIFRTHMIRNISLSQKKHANHANDIQAIRMIRKTQKILAQKNTPCESQPNHMICGALDITLFQNPFV